MVANPRKTSIIGIKCKLIQGCVKKIIEERNDAYWYNFALKGASLKDHIGRVGDLSRWYSQGWFTIAYMLGISTIQI